MYVGTSFGGCIQSILLGEVDEKFVTVIITRTKCNDLDSLLDVLKEYRMYAGQGIYTTNQNERYGRLKEFEWEVVENLARRLWETGKIHQPRLFESPNDNYIWQTRMRTELWLEIVPTEKTDNVSVLDAYNKYKVLRELVK